MSIFDTKPPTFDIDNLHLWLENHYQIFKNNIIQSSRLNSERDYNLKITTKNNKKFVVKISNPYEKIENLEFQDDMLNFLKESMISKYVPETVHNVIEIIKDKENRECYLRILSYLEGDIFGEQQKNVRLCNNLSKFIGNLSFSLKDFKHKSAHKKFIWDSSNINWIEDELELFSDSKKKDIIKMVLNSNQYIKDNNINKIRYSIIHGDVNNYNIITKKEKIIGLLDYGDAIYAPTICELSVALAYALMNSSEIMEKCTYMVKGYHSIFPINKIEIESISTLISARLAITVTMALKQKKKYPNNTYLTISEDNAWKLLYELSDISLQSITKKLLAEIN